MDIETVLKLIATELRKPISGAIFGGTYTIVANAIETAIATAKLADAPTPRKLTHAEKLVELRDNPQVGDAWKYDGAERQIVPLVTLSVVGWTDNDPSGNMRNYVSGLEDAITDIRLVPRPPKPAPTTCVKCEELAKELADKESDIILLATAHTNAGAGQTALLERIKTLTAELSTALARVKELEGKVMSEAVRVFVSMGGCHYAWRGGECFVKKLSGQWMRRVSFKAEYKNAGEYAKVWPDETELTPAEVADLLAKSPLPEETK